VNGLSRYFEAMSDEEVTPTEAAVVAVGLVLSYATARDRVGSGPS
jgi:hypothetical protein